MTETKRFESVTETMYRDFVAKTNRHWHYVLLDQEFQPVDSDWLRVKPKPYSDIVNHYKDGGNVGLIPASMRMAVAEVDGSSDDATEKLGIPAFVQRRQDTSEVCLWYKVKHANYPDFEILCTENTTALIRTGGCYVPISEADLMLLFSKARDNKIKSISLKVFHEGGHEIEHETEQDTKKSKIPTQYDYSFQFAMESSEELRYCHAESNWYKFDGVRWVDGRCRAYGKAMQLVKDNGVRTQQTNGFTRAVVSIVENNSSINIDPNDFDAKYHLLGIPGGVYDFKAGAERDSKPVDYTTLQTNAKIGQKDSKVWLKFLEQFMPDVQTRNWLQLLFGQALIGLQSEHVLPFLTGTGKNGKTVFVEAIKWVFGEYAADLDAENLLQSTNTRHSTDWAQVKGKRLVVVDELPDNAVWNMAKVKQVTGGGEITARRLYQDNVTYTPQFTMVVLANDKPRLRTVDKSITRRLRFIPCTNEPKREDTRLGEKLRAEQNGVMKWLVDGANQYIAFHLSKGKKLGITPLIAEQSASYFEIQDPLGQILCDVQDTTEIPFYVLADGRVARTVALTIARAAMPQMRWNTPKLAAAFEKRGIVSIKSNGYWYYHGIARTNYELPYQQNIV